MKMTWAVVFYVVLAAEAMAASGVSAPGVVDVQQPNMLGITVLDSRHMVVTFSEAMYLGSAQDAAEYVISGAGVGTLTPSPDSVTGSGPFMLEWSTGEMTGGEVLTLSTPGLEDALGNPIGFPPARTANGVGVAPVFSNIAASPASASAGETVSISFDVSEALATEPTVTVNGALATLFSGSPYVFEYRVGNDDALGNATIVIGGLDLAQNAGSAIDTTALEITAPQVQMPSASPFGIALLACMPVLLFFRRQRHMPLLLLLALAPAAMADVAVVSNVAFVQQRTGSGTEVVVTYDLAAESPCNISLWLSKDGGLDGYPYACTSTTGITTGQQSGTGIELVWRPGADIPGEYLSNARLKVTAEPQVLPEMVSVADGTFIMGDLWGGGESDETPTHSVTLSAFKIGTYEITNDQYVLALNWAKSKGYLSTASATSVMAYGEEMIFIGDSFCQIGFNGTSFFSKTRDGKYMGDHPLADVTWYGAGAFCNWISELAGLTPCYNTTTWACTFSNGGYYLPTEAQWEFAASYDSSTPGPTSSRWKYGNSSDTVGATKLNYNQNNPLGFSGFPYTTPVGYYSGNGNGTVLSTSPVGAFDMAGNVSEWVNDWNAAYSASAATNPTGPGSGVFREVRGGAFIHGDFGVRTCDRVGYLPAGGDFFVGFRVAQL